MARAARLAVAVVVAALLTGAAVGAPPDVTTPDAQARPSTPGAIATHDVQSGTALAPNNTTVTGLVLHYERGRNVSLANVTDIQPYVFRNAGTKDYRTETLHPTNRTITERTVRVTLAGNVTIRPGDEVGMEIAGVSNPPRAGPLNAPLIVNPDGPNRTVISTTFHIETPAPRLSNQGHVGQYQRIAVKWPGGVSGFIVARTPDGHVVGVTHFRPRSTLHVDAPLPNFVNTSEVPQGSTVVLTAYHDIDNDTTFDPQIDRVFTENGQNVSIEVSGVLQTTTTTTTTATPTATQSPPTTTVVTSPTTPGSGPGFGLLLAMLGVVAAAMALTRGR